MKSTILLLSMFCIGLISAQSQEALALKKTITSFFESFHAQDSVGMRRVVSHDVILQTIGTNKEGKKRLQTENFDDFIRAITSIPDSVQFEERILDYSIQIDGAMANAWTPYEFWLNGKFHHCGVNSFQLFKEETGWKIIYLIDTRRGEGCEPQ